MTSLMTKSSLYDMVSMIIPGFLIFVWGAHCFSSSLWCSDWLFTKDSWPFVNIIVVFSASYLIGIVFHCLSKRIFNCLLRNNKKRILKAYKGFDKADKIAIPDSVILEEYLKAYYRVFRNYSYTAVPILEAHVSFMRNMVCVIFLYILTTCSWESVIGMPSRTFCAILIIAEIFLITMMLKEQNQIYKSIWEDDYYSTKIKEKKDETNN